MHYHWTFNQQLYFESWISLSGSSGFEFLKDLHCRLLYSVPFEFAIYRDADGKVFGDAS